MKRYGYDRIKLSNAYSIEQLEELLKIVDAEHLQESKEYQAQNHAKWCKKRDQITWAIYYHERKLNPTNGGMTITHVNTEKNW